MVGKEMSMGLLSALTLGTKIPLRVAAYCRVSTADEIQNESYESQRRFFAREIWEHPGWVLAGIYGDKGKSGTSVEGREEFKRMIGYAERGAIDYIITKSISRFSRSTTDVILTLRKLKALGVGVYFMEQGLDTLSDVGQIVIDTLATISEMESLSISRNVKHTMDAMNEKGCPVRKAPYGYEKAGTSWRVVPREALRVKLAFLMMAEGYTFSETASCLNQLERREDTGRVWEGAKVKQILTNEAYVGDVLTNKSVIIWDGNKKKTIRNDGWADQYYIKNHHEPMVGRKLYERMQQLCVSGELAGQRHFQMTRAKDMFELEALAKSDPLLSVARKYPHDLKMRSTRGTQYSSITLYSSEQTTVYKKERKAATTCEG